MFLATTRRTGQRELYGNQLSLYFCELPRFAGPKVEGMSPVEEWFDVIRNMRTFVNRPNYLNARFNSILDACSQQGLDEVEKIQYLRAMLTDNDKRSIVHANYMEGFAEGRDDGFKAGWKEGNAAGVTAGITEGKEKGRNT